MKKKIFLKKKDSYCGINKEALRRSILIFRAANHELRKQIILFIDRNFSSVVKNIHQSLNLEQSVASQHLSILRSAGLVNRISEGKFRRYSVNYEMLSKIGRISKLLSEGFTEKEA